MGIVFSRYGLIKNNQKAVVVVAVLYVACKIALVMCGRWFGFFDTAQLLFMLACFMTIMGLYIKGHRGIKQPLENIHLESGKPMHVAQRYASREGFKSIYFVFAALAICYIPYCIASVISQLGYRALHYPCIRLEYLSVCLVTANSSFCLLILLFSNKDLKDFTMDYFKLRLVTSGVPVGDSDC